MKIDETTVEQGQIDAWKEQHGKVFQTTIDGVDIIWRRLRRKEYVAIMSETAKLDREEAMFARQERFALAAALWPASIETLLEESAGLATQLADEIVVKSGFDFASTSEI